MNEPLLTVTPPAKKRRAIIGIVALFTLAGICTGFVGGQLFTRTQATADVNSVRLQAKNEVDNVRQTYAEVQEERRKILMECLKLAPTAANSAAKAADNAANAAVAAGDAATEARKVIEKVESVPGKTAEKLNRSPEMSNEKGELSNQGAPK